MRPLTDLCRLAIKYSTDKGGRHNTYNHEPCHGTHEYTPVYFDLLQTQRMLVQSVLEIGVNKGCSLRMWEEFFPNAQIIGLDIEPSTLFTTTTRIQTIQANQSNPHSLRNALQRARHWRNFDTITRYDVIIDDGSHAMTDQVVSLNALASLLTDIGVYIIEDIPHDPTWIEYLRKHTPDGLRAGIVVPERGTGTMGPEVLYVATKE